VRRPAGPDAYTGRPAPAGHQRGPWARPCWTQRGQGTPPHPDPG
jgi:hypothetical protein